MMRKRLFWSLVLQLMFGNITSNAKITSQSDLLRDVAEICGTGNHEPADCQLLHQAAQEFGIGSLDTLANMLEGRILDKGDSLTITVINDILNYSEHHFGQISQEAVISRRRLVDVYSNFRWEQAQKLAEQNEECANTLRRKYPKDKEIKLLSLVTQLEHLTILRNHDQDNPEHWAKIIQIEKDLEPYLSGKIVYNPLLVDCCHLMAVYKSNTSTWTGYVNSLIRQTFPKGTYLKGNYDGSNVYSNVEAFIEHVVKGAETLWSEHDLKRILLVSDVATLQMYAKTKPYEALHDKLLEWHTFLLGYLPEGDPMTDQIQLIMWECDVCYGQKLYEIRSPYPILYRYESFYGKESMSYLAMMFNLTRVMAMANPERGKALMKELQILINEQFQNDSDLYGTHLWSLYWVGIPLTNQNSTEMQSCLLRLTDWYTQHHRTTWQSIYIGKCIANFFSSYLSVPDKGVEFYSIAKDDVERLSGEDSQFTISVLENLVSCQMQSSSHDMLSDGERNCKKMMALKNNTGSISAKDYSMLSSFQYKLGKRDEVIKTLREGIAKSMKSEDKMWHCMLQLYLGWGLYSDMSISLDAEPKQLFEEAIPFFIEHIGQFGGSFMEGFNYIGYYYNAIKEYDKVEKTLLAGMKLHESLYSGEYDAFYINMLSDLYTFYVQSVNKYDKAEQLLQGCLEKLRQDPSFSMRGVILKLLWNRYRLLSVKTDDWMLRFTALHEIEAEIDRIKLYSGADVSQLRAMMMPVVYEYANMFSIMGRMLREVEKLHGQNIPGLTEEQTERIMQAVPTLYDAAKTNILPEMLKEENELRKIGDNYLDNIETSNLYSALANYYVSIERDTAKAESYHSQLLASNLPYVRMKAYAELGQLSMQQGHYEQAAHYFEQLTEEIDKGEHQLSSLADRAKYLSCIGDAYLMCGRFKDAIVPAREYFKLRQQQIALNFDLLTQSEREAFIRDGGAGEGGINVLLPKFPEELAGEAYDAALASKGLLLRASERIESAVMNSNNNALMALVDSLNQLSAHFKTLVTQNQWQFEYSGSGYNPEAIALRQQIETLERNINRQASQFIEGMNTPDWKSLQSVLKEGEAAIEYVLSDSASCGALILLPHEEPYYIPLTSPIRLWEELSLLNKTEAQEKAEDLYMRDNLKLYDKLWKPLEEKLKGVTKVFYSPTGFLNELAFPAFKCPDDTYLSDHYELHQMLSTGDLVSLRSNTEEGGVKSALLYGSVFYSPEHEQVAQSITEDNLRDKHRGAVEEAFDYLPFTKQEILQVEDIMHNSHIETNSYMGFSSTEETFRAISGHSPDILHLSTHGFFVRGDKDLMENAFLSRFPTMRFSSMQRSGLALVEANRTWEGATDKPEDSDGIITANEVALLDLSHTRLAVLSACQTAVGDFSTEGVYGMHRGFKQAGVKSILASLWNVNDKSTARLMELFYEKWLAGMPMQQSLNEAVRELRKEYPSPFYWAPFVLMDAEN